jgi:hypothetical protein
VEGVVAGGRYGASGAVAAAAGLALEDVGGGVVGGQLGQEGVGCAAGGAGGQVHGRRNPTSSEKERKFRWGREGELARIGWAWTESSSPSSAAVGKTRVPLSGGCGCGCGCGGSGFCIVTVQRLIYRSQDQPRCTCVFNCRRSRYGCECGWVNPTQERGNRPWMCLVG